MEILSIVIDNTTAVITLVVVVIMAIIGYYADKTKFANNKDGNHTIEKENDKKKKKNIDLSNARLSDVVGEQKMGDTSLEDNMVIENTITFDEPTPSVEAPSIEPTQPVNANDITYKEIVSQEEPITITETGEDLTAPLESSQPVVSSPIVKSEEPFASENTENNIAPMTFDDDTQVDSEIKISESLESGMTSMAQNTDTPAGVELENSNDLDKQLEETVRHSIEQVEQEEQIKQETIEQPIYSVPTIDIKKEEPVLPKMEEKSSSLDEDLGINNIPTLKTENDTTSLSGELAVDDIFKL